MVCLPVLDILAENSIVVVQYPEYHTDTLKLQISDHNNGPKELIISEHVEAENLEKSRLSANKSQDSFQE